MKIASVGTGTGPRLLCLGGIEGTIATGVSLTTVDPYLPNSLVELLRHHNWRERCQTVQAVAPTETMMSGPIQPPIVDPGKIICIGLNYRDHAEEAGMEIPSEPVVFSKFPNSIIGPGQPIVLPRVATQVDYEAELVVVIGRKGRNIPREQAFDYVAGYMNGHDVSARDWQIGKPGKQWLLGKTADTFAPIGPWLATKEEIPDPHNLNIELRVNGKTMQSGSTSSFIFRIDKIIAYLSQLMTLNPGDLIFTGTPPGVGMGRKPPVWLKAGDTVEVEIEGLGVLSNPVVNED